jgi:hypothetical protein
MRQIPLSDQIVERLKELAEPLEDTYDSVVARLLDSYEKQKGAIKAATASDAPAPLRVFDPFAAPSLTHTKVTFASLAGETLASPNWNKLLDNVLLIARKKCNSFSEVRGIATVNLIEGKKSDEGYHYLVNAGFSAQGQDANDAWRGVAHICRVLGLAVEVHFMWRVKEGATYPGSTGAFRIRPRV